MNSPKLFPDKNEPLDGSDVTNEAKDHKEPPKEGKSKDPGRVDDVQDAGDDEKEEAVSPAKYPAIVPANSYCLCLGCQGAKPPAKIPVIMKISA